MELKAVLELVPVLLLALCVSHTSGRQGKLARNHNHLGDKLKKVQAAKETPRCFCQLKTGEAGKEIVQDFGNINLAEPQIGGMSQKDRCRKMKHSCRKECELRSHHLEAKVPSEGTLGYRLCAKFGSPTEGEGLVIQSQAVLEGCGLRKPIKPTTARKRLCCGHSAITVKGSGHILAFGWNQDCKGIAYIVAED